MANPPLVPLDPPERAVVKEEVRFWHQRKRFVHLLVVKPSHVHLLALPLSCGPNEWYSLSEVLHSIKRRSALSINERRGRRGSLWERESYDRLIRNAHEFDETYGYLLENAASEVEGHDPYRYDGLWCPDLAEADPEAPGPTLPPSGVGRRVRIDDLMKRYRRLPHWEEGGSVYHVGFHLRGHRPLP